MDGFNIFSRHSVNRYPHLSSISNQESMLTITCSSEKGLLVSIQNLKEHLSVYKFRASLDQTALPICQHCLRMGYAAALRAIPVHHYREDSIAYFCSLNWDQFEAPAILDMLKQLLEGPVDINGKDEQGITGLEYLLQKRDQLETKRYYWECIVLFIRSKADLTIVGKDGLYPFSKIKLEKGCPLSELDYLECASEITKAQTVFVQSQTPKAKEIARTTANLINVRDQLDNLIKKCEGIFNRKNFKTNDPATHCKCETEEEFVNALYDLKEKVLEKFYYSDKDKLSYPAVYFCIKNHYLIGLLELIGLIEEYNIPNTFKKQALFLYAAEYWDQPVGTKKEYWEKWIAENSQGTDCAPHDSPVHIFNLLKRLGADVNGVVGGQCCLAYMLKQKPTLHNEEIYWRIIFHLIHHLNANMKLISHTGRPCYELINLEEAVLSPNDKKLLDAKIDICQGEFFISQLRSMETKLGLQERISYPRLDQKINPRGPATRHLELETCLEEGRFDDLESILKANKSEYGLNCPKECFLAYVCSKYGENEKLPDYLRLLIKYGAYVDSKDINGKTALEHLVNGKNTKLNWECIIVLLEAGANTSNLLSNKLTIVDVLKSRDPNFIDEIITLESDFFSKEHGLLITQKLHPVLVSHEYGKRSQSRLSRARRMDEEKDRIRIQKIRHSENSKPIIQPVESSQNLKPIRFFGKNEGKIKFRRKTEEIYPEVFSEEQEELKKLFIQYFNTRFKGKLDCISCEIIDVLSGRITLDETALAPENAREYLMKLKLLELTQSEFNRGNPRNRCVFPCSSLSMREFILNLCSPDMTTCEAFTKSLDPRKIKDRAYLQNPNNWIPERVCFQYTILAKLIIHAAEKQRHQNLENIVLNVVRGGTAFGKSYAMENDKIFRNSKRIELDPDVVKYLLKIIQIVHRLTSLKNTQVHDEGIILYNKFKEIMFSPRIQARLSIEGRFSTPEEIELNVLGPARKKGWKVAMMDIHHESIVLSGHRTLVRDPEGRDPCPPLVDIIKGFCESILYRKRLIEVVRNDDTVQFYRLCMDDVYGRRIVVAEKIQGDFKIYANCHKYGEICFVGRNKVWSFEADCHYKHALHVPDVQTLYKDLSKPIEYNTYELYRQLGTFSDNATILISAWSGIPLAKAIEMNRQGVQPNKADEIYKKNQHYQEKFGPVRIERFDESWLKDFPSLLQHIIREQELHSRGVDENGSGLHFITGTFSSKLNPEYNPENRIQQRVGYFIIPEKHAEVFKTKKLSTDIQKQLEVIRGNEVIGYRLFVHPECYEHYQPLMEAGFEYVKAIDSTFMGAPTSSYRSWIVRDCLPNNDLIKKLPNFMQPVYKHSIPFIVKFGVSSSSTDPMRLLPLPDIKRCIDTQRELDEMESVGSLTIFQENFGLALKQIPNYPSPSYSSNGQLVDSGMIIRELPKDLLQGNCVISLASLFSVERSLPYIFELIDNRISIGDVKNTSEFFMKYFIKGFLKAIEKLHFEDGIALPLHGQNVCLSIGKEITFVLRDLEGFSLKSRSGYIETYSWFWRYHNVQKLFNILVNSKEERVLPPPGAPTQLNCVVKPLERNLQPYIRRKINELGFHDRLEILDRLSITKQEADDLLVRMDKAYLQKLNYYFDVHASGIVIDGLVPSAEKGSSGESRLHQYNTTLWKYRRAKPL